MSTLEERVAAIRARKAPVTTPTVSLEERVAAIRARKENPQGAPLEAPEVTTPVDPDSLSSIVGRTVDSLQANLGGTVEAIGEATGSEYLQDLGADYREEQLQEASQYGQPSISSYKQVDWTNPEDIGSYFKEIGVSGGTSMAAIAPGAVAGAKLAPGALKPIGAMAGAFLGSFGINAGEVQNELKRVDPNGEHPWAALGSGAVISTLDAAGLGTMVKPFLKTFGKDVVYRNLVQVGVPKEAALQAVKTGVTEAATEGAQSAIKDVTVAKATDTELNVDRLMENAINGAIGGVTVGGVAGAGAGTATAIQNNRMVSGSAAPQKDINKGQTEAPGLPRKVFEVLGTASSNMLEPLARVSPIARSVLQKFTPDRSGAVASAPTIFEENDLLVGKYRTALEDVIGKKSNKQKKAIIEDYLNGGTSQEALQLKSIMDNFRGEAKAVGMDVGYIDRFLPTTFDKKAIQKNRDQVIQDFAPYLGGVQNATNVVDSWLALKEIDPSESVPKVERLLEQNQQTGEWMTRPSMQKGGDPESFKYKFAQGYIPPKFGHLEQNRLFANVPQAVLEKYTKEKTPKAKVQAIYDYLEGGAHRINFVKHFGETGEKLNGAIVQAVNEAQQQGRQVTKDEVDRFYELADAYNGMLNPIRSKTLKTALGTGQTVATIAALPLATLSSLAEIALPAVRGDIKNAALAIVPTTVQMLHDLIRTSFKNVPRTDFSRIASEANITLGAAMNITAERLGTNMLSRKNAWVMNKFFLVNGLTIWTHMMRVYAAKTGQYVIRDALKELSFGLPLDSSKGRMYVNQLNSLGISVRNTQEATDLYAPDTPSKAAVSKQVMVHGIRRFVSQTVLEPNVANTPMWMHDGRVQILAGLRRYPAAFTNEILPHFIRRSSASFQGGLAGAMGGAVGTLFLLSFILAVGYLQDDLKRMAKSAGTFERDTRSDGERFMDVMNSTISPLHVGFVSDFFAAPRYGSDPLSVVAGPTIGAGIKVAVNISNFMEDPQEGLIWKTLHGLTPVAPFRAFKEASAEIDAIDSF